MKFNLLALWWNIKPRKESRFNQQSNQIKPDRRLFLVCLSVGRSMSPSLSLYDLLRPHIPLTHSFSLFALRSPSLFQRLYFCLLIHAESHPKCLSTHTTNFYKHTHIYSLLLGILCLSSFFWCFFLLLVLLDFGGISLVFCIFHTVDVLYLLIFYFHRCVCVVFVCFFCFVFDVVCVVVFAFNAIMRLGRCLKSCCIFLAFFYFDLPTQNNQENVRQTNTLFWVFRKQKTFFDFYLFLKRKIRLQRQNFNLIVTATVCISTCYVVVYVVVVFELLQMWLKT